MAVLVLIAACVGPGSDTVLREVPAQTEQVQGDDPGGTGEDTAEELPLGDPDLVCQMQLSCTLGVLDAYKQPCSFVIEGGEGTELYTTEFDSRNYGN